MEYLKMLVMQYMYARGMKVENYDMDSILFIYSVITKRDFKEFIEQRCEMGVEYVKYLEYLGKYIDTFSTAEIGKGLCDSVVIPHKTKDDTPNETTIITPYISREEIGKIPNGEDRVFPYYCYYGLDKNAIDTLLFTHFNEITRKTEIVQPPLFVDTYMTQNPYRALNIKGWELFDSSIVGMFGSIQDEDKKMKLESLKYFKEKLEMSGKKFITDFGLFGNSYYAVVATRDFQKEKVKTR